MKIKNFLDIDWGKSRQTYNLGGKHSIIIDDPANIKEWLNLDIPRGYCLKVFKSPEYWQSTFILEATLIQNIFWINGLAPRVIHCEKVTDDTKEFWIQIVEYVQGQSILSKEERKQKLEKVANDNFISVYNGEHDEILTNDNNWRGDKYIDFGGFKLDEAKYKEKLIAEINDVTHFGKAYKGKRASYQSIPDWDVDGKRKTDYRIKTTGLDQIDFKDKSVLDIGCNLGAMLHYAHSKGATTLTGYDKPVLIKVAKEYANLRGLHELNLYAQDLTKIVPSQPADIVFFLAMSKYLGFPQWLADMTKEICFYEGHANDDVNYTEKELNKLFSKVVSKGISNDRSERCLYVCYK